MKARLLPTLVAGLGGAGGTALAAGRELATPSDERALLTGTASAGATSASGVQALALVTLACWGVLLVSRGLGRQLVAGLGLVAALGSVVGLALAGRSIPRTLRDELVSSGGGAAEIHLTWWFWLAIGAALVSAAATSVAVTATPAWSEMGRRYDAPASGGQGRAGPDAETGNLDLWRTMDEGHDPTT